MAAGAADGDESARSPEGGTNAATPFVFFVFQDTGLSESMEIDHNSSANFDEVRTSTSV